MGAAILCTRCGYESPRVFSSCARCLGGLTRGDASEMLTGGDTLVDIIVTPAGHSSPAEPGLLGQDEAVRAIHSGVDRAFGRGSPSLVALLGRRGAGKSRLLFQAAHEATRIDPQARVLYTAARAERDGSYAPFSRLLRERFDVALDPRSLRANERLLAHIAGMPADPDVEASADVPQALHQGALGALRALFEAEITRRPTLLLLDDMHLAEAPAWELLAALTEIDGPLAIVLAGDASIDERVRALSAPSGTSALPIAALREADVRTMLLSLIPELEEIPATLASALTLRSEGNPRALRELVLAHFDAGQLVRDAPASLEEAIRARLKRLDPLTRATVERAAIVGEVFFDQALLAQMRAEAPAEEPDLARLFQDDEDAAALDAALARLVDNGFIELEVDAHLLGAREYRFCLSGTRRHLYLSLDEDTRERRHAVVARWLSVAAGSRRDELAWLIAPHLERASQRIGAGRAYLTAALRERAQGQTARALTFVERSLAQLPEDDAELRIEALHLYGALLGTLGRYDQALEVFGELLVVAHRVGARGKGGAALNRIARVHRERGDEVAALETLGRALALFRAAADQRGVAACQDDLAQIAMRRGELEVAVRAASEALDIRRAHGDRRGEALSLTTLGRIELRRGNITMAETLLRAGLELRRALDDRDGVRQSLGALGRLWLERGDRAEATRTWQTGLAQAREACDRRSEALFLINLGEALLLEGRLDAAAEYFEQARALSRELGDQRATAEIERHLGRLAMRRGDPSARAQLEGALRLAELHGSPKTVALAHRNLGQLDARTLFDSNGSVPCAIESFLTSIDLFRELGNEKEAARSLMDLGQHLLEASDVEGAKERLGEARAILRTMGLPEAERVGRLLAELA